MTSIYHNGNLVTTRHALGVWRHYSAHHGHDTEATDEIFAIALYSEEPTDAEMSPEHARDLISESGVEIVV